MFEKIDYKQISETCWRACLYIRCRVSKGSPILDVIKDKLKLEGTTAEKTEKQGQSKPSIPIFNPNHQSKSPLANFNPQYKPPIQFPNPFSRTSIPNPKSKPYFQASMPIPNANPQSQSPQIPNIQSPS